MDIYKDVNEQGYIIKNEEALLNYIDNILSTKVGTRAFLRSFGSFLEKYLFEPLTFTTKKKIELEIERVLTKWIKDIKITQVDINQNITKKELNIKIYIYSDKLKNIVFEKTFKQS